MKIALIVLALVVLGLAIYVRLAPLDPADWHVDPARAPATGVAGHSASFDTDLAPAEALARLDAIALGTTRTRRLAGSVEGGHVSYVTRSLLLGFPDITSVTAVPEGDRTRLVFFARQRFGRGDMGVNRARLDAWTAALGKAP